MKENGQSATHAKGHEMREANRPVETLRVGSLKASIWRNEGDNGVSYSTTFAQMWKDDHGRYHDSNSYYDADMLKLGELTRAAYHRTNELRRDHAREQEQSSDQKAQSQMDFRKSRAGASVDKGREHTR
ncbi:MAG: hypothetical protein ACFB11_02540 [Paracoccaceae bacterium]